MCVCLRQVPELAFPRLRVKVQGPFGANAAEIIGKRGRNDVFTVVHL